MRQLPALALAIASFAAPIAAQQVTVTLDPSVASGPTTGRLFVIFGRTGAREPRFQAGSYGGSVPFYGIDVDGWRPGAASTVGAKVLGFPFDDMAHMPAGDYYAQALLNVYTQFHRADGHAVWVHADQWEGQQWATSPGNLVSDVVKVHFDPAAHTTVKLTLTKKLPPAQLPADTRWVKHVKMKSELLSKFWGAPVYIGATVLVPNGFDASPNARYPAVYSQGHFGLGAPFGFVDPSAPNAGRGGRGGGRGRGGEPSVWDPTPTSARESGSEFAKSWTSAGFPKFVAITWQHPTPYYDDSYAVNSANNGPYQDALLTELVPELERRFRLIPEANARFLTGGSTGGWECAALQVQRADFFGGAWCLYPDPVDFRRNQTVDIYADSNAFFPNNALPPVPERSMSRTPEGQDLLSFRMMSRLEAVLGAKARSGQQFDAWDAAYGPVGADGYPRRLWDRATGVIDKSVAAYWRDKGFDLTWNLRQNWAKIGPELTGKMHVYVGDMDNYYLNLGVYLMEQESKKLTNPQANFTFEYGRPMK
ncbi:MAG: hypothetical protein ACREPM_11605, partial [Gemmatimonadaceae bacterium]